MTSSSATATPTLGMVTPPGGELMSYASATQWLLDDSKFNMEQWLLDNIAEEHAFQEGAAFITGNGICYIKRAFSDMRCSFCTHIPTL